jgi:hypothetical protein
MPLTLETSFCRMGSGVPARWLRCGRNSDSALATCYLPGVHHGPHVETGMSFAQRLQRLASTTSIDSAPPSPFNAQPRQCSTTPCTRAPLPLSPLLCVCTTTHPPAPHELPLLYHRTRLLALLALLALLPVPSARPDSHHAYLRGCDSTSKARCLTMHRCRHDALCTTPLSILSPSRVNSRPVLHSRVRWVALHSTNAYAALRWNNARSADDPRVLGQSRLDFCTRCVETNVPTHGRRSIIQVRQQ